MSTESVKCAIFLIVGSSVIAQVAHCEANPVRKQKQRNRRENQNTNAFFCLEFLQAMITPEQKGEVIRQLFHIA
jgi:hypothetical protein